MGLAGDVGFSSRNFVVDLAQADALTGLSLRWESGQVTVTRREWQDVAGLAEGSNNPPSTETFSIGAGVLGSRSCVGDTCRIGVTGANSNALIEIRGHVYTHDLLTSTATRLDFGSTSAADDAGFHLSVPARSMILDESRCSAWGSTLRGGCAFVGRGDMNLALDDVRVGLRLLPSNETRTFEARSRTTTTTDPAGLTTIGRTSEHTMVTLALRGVEIVGTTNGTTLYAISGRMAQSAVDLSAASAHAVRLVRPTTLLAHQVPVVVGGDLGMDWDANRGTLVVTGQAERVHVGEYLWTAEKSTGATPAGFTAISLAVAVAIILIKSGFGVQLYTRVAPERVLDAPVRRRLYEKIKSSRGVNICELARECGISRGGARYHLRVLERARLVLHHDYGHEILYVAAGSANTGRGVTHVALRDPTRAAVYRALLSKPGGYSQREVAEACEISSRLASHHVGTLESAGLVSVIPGRPRRYIVNQSDEEPQGEARALASARGPAPHSS